MKPTNLLLSFTAVVASCTMCFADVIGNDHRIVETGFYLSEGFHRADVAHLEGDLFAIAAVSFDSLPTASDPGEGMCYLYDWRSNSMSLVGFLGADVQTVRVAQGVKEASKGLPTVASSWFAWERADGVYLNRLDARGHWAGASTFLANASGPVLITGERAGEPKVLLLYAINDDPRSYLYYRFLGADGAVGPAYSIRSIGSPWHFWHVEGAYNPFQNRWRVFWDERDSDTLGTNMRTKYIRWDGHHSNSSYLLTCQSGGPSLAPRDTNLELDYDAAKLFAPDETEWQELDLPETTGDPFHTKYHNEGCKRFFASFDPTSANSTHRYLLSMYGHALTTVGEDGAIVEGRIGDFVIPLTGVCNRDWCSYREITSTQIDAVHFVLNDNTFSDQFNFSCSGATPDEITPTLYLPYPVAMASNDEATIVLYNENVTSVAGYLYLTAIEN